MQTAIDFGIWLLALAFFALAFIVDLERFSFLRRDEVQLVLGVLIVGFIVFVDAVVGLLLGLGFLVLFYRTHSAMMPTGESWAGSFRDHDLMVTVDNYITPRHLEQAQQNTIDANTNNKMVGIKDPYGGAVYDAQGTFDAMPGNDLMESRYSPIVS
jgi:hypothetical protein